MSADFHHVEVQYAVSTEGMPSGDQVREWAGLALQQRQEPAELVVRIVDEAEITALNRRYRGKDGATNVLSFPSEPVPGLESALLGDIVICAPVVAAEAALQGKSPEAHWAHMVIHGVLHLLGYDHQKDSDARAMERLEVEQLASLGFPDPY